MSALITYLSNIWTSLSPGPAKRRSRRIANIDPDSIEPINHWFPGNRAKKQPRRLVETPTAGHWPEFRIAKSVVGKGRRRCTECGALVKGGPRAGVTKASGKKNTTQKKKKVAGKRSQVKSKPVSTRSLRGRTDNIDE